VTAKTSLARLTGDLRRQAVELLRPTRSLSAPTLRMWYFDAALALVMAALAVHSIQNRQDVHPTLIARPDVGVIMVPVSDGVPTFPIVLTLLASLPLALRRKYPLAVFWIVLASTLKLGNAPTELFFTVIVAAYSAAAYSPYRTAAIGSLALAAVIVASTLRSTVPSIPNALGPFVILLPIAWVANSIRTWKQQAATNLAKLRAVEEGQERATREAVELERARIARELHDVVTHNVSVMVVQAGAARKVMDAAPQQATQALLAVEASGRTAMAELRQVMGLLTSAADGSDGPLDANAKLAPQPDLDQLETLVGRVRATGVPVTLTFTGAPPPLPPGVGLAAYRVVQEALTNTVKHAVGASAQVTVDYAPRRLRLEIADTGGVAGEAAAAGNRRGLIGLQERLAVYGGSLEAVRRPTGGFRVTAVIPLEPSEERDAVVPETVQKTQ
jgi:signal transduction histidine kinase